MYTKLRFGAFLPPLHAAWRNPTRALRRDLDLAVTLDRNGFDEMWFGEHHGLGWEISGSPEVMIAAAAERTTRIKLATGVISLPYHHPLVVADRLMLLDHLTQGRFIFGAGPGAFPSDAHVLGIDYMRNREHMVASLEAIVELLTSDEPVNRETEWFVLRDARLNLRPFSDPCFEIVVTAVATTSGPKLAGRLGTGLLSLSVNSPQGFDALRTTWSIAEDAAAAAGTTIDRSHWRITQFCHIAETEEQARQDVRYGLHDLLEYFRGINPASAFHDPSLTDLDDIIDDMNKSGTAVIGSPDRLVQSISGLQEQSGGFGAFLSFVTEMADPDATAHSHELIASDVMPHFQRSIERPMAAYRFVTEPPPTGEETWSDITYAAYQKTGIIPTTPSA
jgi:limonene 1,2-monooxygenase